jgi:hypothetical protein
MANSSTGSKSQKVSVEKLPNPVVNPKIRIVATPNGGARDITVSDNVPPFCDDPKDFLDGTLAGRRIRSRR